MPTNVELTQRNKNLRTENKGFIGQNTTLNDQLKASTTSNRRRAGGVAAVTGAAGLAIGLLWGSGTIGISPSRAAATPSEAVGTATPRPTDAAGTVNPSETAESFDIQSILKSIRGDVYFKDSTNWHLIADNGTPGAVMAPDSTGMNHVVSTLGNAVGQAYWDAKVAGEHKAISLVLAPNVAMPVRGITEWPVQPGQTSEQATEAALQGQAALEASTQPNVCTLEVTDSAQAISGTKFDLSNPPQWEAKKISAEQAATLFGRDVWSMDASHWSKAPDGYGMVLKPNPDGSNSMVEMTDAVGQAYWDAKVAGEHQAIAGTLAPGATAPVRGITVYDGVPQGMEDAVTTYAHKQAVNLEIDTQEGVWVIKVSKSVCPVNTSTSATAEPTSVAVAKPTVRPATKPTAEQTAQPTAAPDWRITLENAEKLTDRGQLLSDGGLKIVYGDTAITVTIDGTEKLLYWDGAKNVKVEGPASRMINEGTVYKK